MEQDPFPGTEHDPGHSPGYSAHPGLDSEATSAYGHSRTESAQMSSGHDGRRDDADEVGRIRSFLEDQLRERPLPTLLLGVLAGWIAGKLLR